MVFQCWAVSAACRYHSNPNVDGYGTLIYRLPADTRLCRRDLYNAAEGYCHVWPTGSTALSAASRQFHWILIHHATLKYTY
jgi:hypothetical protein